MILKEGGNIFKDADGKPTTTRISRDAVDPTLDWVEKVTGLKLKDNKLGSTGIKASSGDIDVAVVIDVAVENICEDVFLISIITLIFQNIFNRGALGLPPYDNMCGDVKSVRWCGCDAEM